MEVRVEPSTVKREEFGTMLGTVVTVSDFPDHAAGHGRGAAQRQSGHALFARRRALCSDDPAGAGSPPPTSGYRWAVGQGPPIRLTSGTLTRAEITTRKQRPIDLVVPLIKRLTGIDG